MPKVEFNSDNFFFHGTNNLYEKLISKEIIITTRKRGGVDFGPGFYLTQNENQAREFTSARTNEKKWAIPQREVLDKLGMSVTDFLRMKDSLEPVIMVYKLKNSAYWEQLYKEKQFILYNNGNMNWKKHIWTWRQSESPPDKWLATYGPVADGGGIYSPTFKDIKAIEDMDQLAIHDKTLAKDYLDLVEVIPC